MATTTTHTGVPAEHGTHGTFPPFQQETFGPQLLWLAITFVVLYVLMSRIGLPRVGSIIEARSTRIASDVAEADRFKEEAEAESAAYDRALAEARARAHAIADETRQATNAEAEQNRRKLEDRLNAELAEAERSIATARTAAMSNVRGIAVDAAAEIVKALLGTAPSNETVAAAVDAALER
jgi:F-type H+-transporting ATPase subunit b